MACGVAVVTTFNAGATDLVKDGRSGFIVPIRDSDIMAERLQTLADDPELCAQMGIRGRESVEVLGGWDSYGEDFRAVCTRLTGGK
jgi:glycosyltransferase involved in cell wall biosynthesis